jgi:hypothetical protein
MYDAFFGVDGAHIVFSVVSVVPGFAGPVVLFAAFTAFLIVVCDTPYSFASPSDVPPLAIF